MDADSIYDTVIIGAGVSGSFLAAELTRSGRRCVLLEAGRSYGADTYPTDELRANAELYWGGGLELNTDASIGLLRPKAVGGGSIVNQALLDRFDDLALDEWRDVSGVEFFSRTDLDPWYDRVGEQIQIRTVPEEYRNGNAEVFRRGFEANGYRCAPLERGQADCRFGHGNSCIVCLAGCPIDSKQSTAVSVLPSAVAEGLEIVSQFEAVRVHEDPDGVCVAGRIADGSTAQYRGRSLVLGSRRHR